MALSHAETGDRPSFVLKHTKVTPPTSFRKAALPSLIPAWGQACPLWGHSRPSPKCAQAVGSECQGDHPLAQVDTEPRANDSKALPLAGPHH